MPPALALSMLLGLLGSVQDLREQVDGYRAERKKHLEELGTPGSQRYAGAKLNGRGPHATCETCAASECNRRACPRGRTARP